MQYLLTIFLSATSVLSAQLTVIVDKIPQGTPSNTPVYIAGDFQSWQAGDPDYQLMKVGKNHVIELNLPAGKIEFKFTRGTWDAVEGNANGGFRENRIYNYGGGKDTLYQQILSWQGKDYIPTTASENVTVLDDAYYMPQLDRNRRIWLYLPPDYHDTKKSYPVIYMHDGQNLFDEATSYSGEWKIDETLNELHASGDKGCIVVGIDNGGAERLNEYSPWQNPQYGGGMGRDYDDFIVEIANVLHEEIYNSIRSRFL